MSFYGNRVPRGWVPEFPLANHSPVPPALRPGAAELLGIKEPEPEVMEIHDELDGFDPAQDNDEAVAKDLLSLAAERVFVPEPPQVEPSPPPTASQEEAWIEDDQPSPPPAGPEVLVASTAKKRMGRPKKNQNPE